MIKERVCVIVNYKHNKYNNIHREKLKKINGTYFGKFTMVVNGIALVHSLFRISTADKIIRVALVHRL